MVDNWFTRRSWSHRCIYHENSELFANFCCFASASALPANPALGRELWNAAPPPLSPLVCCCKINITPATHVPSWLSLFLPVNRRSCCSLLRPTRLGPCHELVLARLILRNTFIETGCATQLNLNKIGKWRGDWCKKKWEGVCFFNFFFFSIFIRLVYHICLDYYIYYVL